MLLKLRYIFLFIAANWLLSSCESKGEDVAMGSEVTFVVANLSRASATTDIGEFAIYGDMKLVTQTVIFNNDVVRNRNGQWGYDYPQYWYPKHEHSFIAMHPVVADGLSAKQYSDSRLSFNYTIPDNYQEACDLMIATHRRKVDSIPTSQDAAPISLKFSHILSRVDFQVKNDAAADIVRVEKIVIQGVNKTGTFSVTPAPLLPGSKQTDDFDLSWTGISNPAAIAANFNIDIPEDETRSLFPDDNALFVIPQPDNKGIIMKITYTLIDAGADDVQLTAEAPISGWQLGKMYTYSLSIEEISKEVSLTVSVKPWQTPTGADITVPES